MPLEMLVDAGVVGTTVVPGGVSLLSVGLVEVRVESITVDGGFDPPVENVTA
jgi:hypothetical protein